MRVDIVDPARSSRESLIGVEMLISMIGDEMLKVLVDDLAGGSRVCLGEVESESVAGISPSQAAEEHAHEKLVLVGLWSAPVETSFPYNAGISPTHAA